MQLPKNMRGNTWFWKFLKDGESGFDLANRVPPIPESYDQDAVMVWTRICGRNKDKESVALIGTKDGKMWSALLNKNDNVMVQS